MVNPAKLPTIEQRFRQLQKQLEDERALNAEVLKCVVRPGEQMTGHEGVRRVKMMASAYVDVSMRLTLLEALVRELGPCDVDSLGVCHSHGPPQSAALCPAAKALAACRALKPPAPVERLARGDS